MSRAAFFIILATVTVTQVGACWLSRDLDACSVDGDCAAGESCFDNNGIKVCLPQAAAECLEAGSEHAACFESSDVGGSDAGDARADSDASSDGGGLPDSDLGGSDSTDGDTISDDIVDDDVGGGDLGTEDLGVEDISPGDTVSDSTPDHPSLTTPTGVEASDGTSADFVHVSWNRVSGATSYRVLRDDTVIEESVVGTSLDDNGAARLPPSATGFTLSASSNLGDVVRLTWAEPETTTVHRYQVVALADSSESAPSATDTGYRSTPPITHYEIEVDGGAWTSVGTTFTWDDDSAAAPTFDSGTVVASDATSIYGVELAISGIVSVDGDSSSYRIRAVSALGDGTPSPTANGHRAAPPAGPLQWQRSESTENTAFEDIDGAQSAVFTDADAPLDGNSRYYRVRIGESEYSDSDEGSRRVFEFAGDCWIEDGYLYEQGSINPENVFGWSGTNWDVAGTLPADHVAVSEMTFGGEVLVTYLVLDDCSNGPPDDDCVVTSSYSVDRLDTEVGQFVVEDYWFDLDGSGFRFVLSSDWLLLGASAAGSRYGAVETYRYDIESEDWPRRGELPYDSPGEGRFGEEMDLYPPIALASLDVDGVGSVRIYRLEGDSWSFEQSITREVPEGTERFGAVLATDGQSVVVGVPNDDGDGTDAGAVYVYAPGDGPSDWEELARLAPSTPSDGAEFGARVGVYGDTIAVASPGESAAYVFKRTSEPDGWSQHQRLVRDDLDSFGQSVDIAGDWLAVDRVVSFIGVRP